MTLAFALLTLIAADADSILKRGKPIPAGPSVSVSTVLADPARFAEGPVIVEGMVIRSCTKMGCWMQLADGPDAKGVRVDFHPGKFFIPVGAAGMRARTIGTVKVAVLKEEEVAHLEGEGAAVERNAKGEAIEVELVAAGVELHYVD